MTFNILVYALTGLLAVLVAIDIVKQNKVIDRMAKLALKVAELEDTIRHIDESTGIEIHSLREELRSYQSLYGEAAVEEIRERARREKAWAEGISNIMEYGSQYQGKGE